jgi:hypothetical protein
MYPRCHTFSSSSIQYSVTNIFLYSIIWLLLLQEVPPYKIFPTVPASTTIKATTSSPVDAAAPINGTGLPIPVQLPLPVEIPVPLGLEEDADIEPLG